VAGRPAATTGPAPRQAGTGEFTVVDVPIRSWRRLPPSPPLRLEIPAIGVSSPLVRLGFNPDGTMQVPGDFQVAGWFTGGPQPGQLGPAVIAGHVDSRTGPAVFYRLRDLRPGDQIRVVRADRLVVRFQVESLARYPKRSLPDEAVYGATTAPALRLITCAGTFDRARHSYRDNLVVSAVRIADGHGRAEAGR
jgi:sortase (surface protein transpeptidase)